jgi:hypothetical protein
MPSPVNTTASISGVTVISRSVIKVDFNTSGLGYSVSSEEVGNF